MSYRNRNVLMDEADDGTGGSAGGAGGGTEPTAGEKQVALLTEAVGTLARGLEELRGNQSSITEALAKLAEGAGQTSKEQKQIAQDLFGDDVDLETLSRKDFAKLIQASIQHGIKGELDASHEKIAGQINDLASRFESKNAKEQIESTAEKNADFWEWSSEIKKVLAENPTLSVTRAYNLVKAENPEKAQKLEQKYTKPAAKKEPPFVGLTPTSMRNGADGSNKKMTPTEAANAAFEKVMAGVGDVFKQDESII